jgi:hypothetical protein
MNNHKIGRDTFSRLMAKGKIAYDIGYRGGSCGIDSYELCLALFEEKGTEKVEEISSCLPSKTGVFCNYMGGGLRGSICHSPFNRVKYAYAKERIEGFIQACNEFYNACEESEGLQDAEYPDGDTNWDVLGTNKMRAAGVVSAF